MIYRQNWLLLLLWFWSETIGPEFPPPDLEPALLASPAAPPKQAPPATTRLDLKTASPDEGDPIDAQAFAASFKRQAASALTSCLQQTQAGPGSVMLSGQLEKSGRLRLVRPVGSSPLPDCATQAIEAMDFQALTALMETESQHIQWRLDY